MALRVLVVDDNADAAQSMAILMQAYGYDVWVAQNGREALEAAREHSPDAVLLDLAMPAMDGYKVARSIQDLSNARTASKKPLIIAITGLGSNLDREHSAQAGIDLHLLKPADPVHLRTLLDTFHSLMS